MARRYNYPCILVVVHVNSCVTLVRRIFVSHNYANNYIVKWNFFFSFFCPINCLLTHYNRFRCYLSEKSVYWLWMTLNESKVVAEHYTTYCVAQWNLFPSSWSIVVLMYYNSFWEISMVSSWITIHFFDKRITQLLTLPWLYATHEMMKLWMTESHITSLC